MLTLRHFSYESRLEECSVKILLSAFLLLCASTASAATTYYVRTDGGAPASCSGLVNAPYSSTVANKACAIAHPMYLLPPNRDGNDVGRKPMIARGDTVMIAAGAYQFGLPFNGGSWGSCSASWPWDCHMAPIPSGTAAQPTRIIGAGSASTTFWGSGGASFVINLSGSSNVVIQGVTITDHSNCIQNHTNPAVKCQSGGLWAATGISDTEGGTDTPQSSNVTLTDVVIRGMAKFGLLAGHIDSWTLSNVKVIANGFGGWSLDTGPSYSRGTNTITNSEFSWNGCTENYPATTIYACWGQQSGGYGDGLGSSSASDHGTWNFSLVDSHDNTQDGIDFLHADPSAVITFDRVNAYRNAGNQLKGNGSVALQNSVVNAFCSAFKGVGDMGGNNSGGGGTSGDNCRALGDAVVFGMSAGHTVTLQNNTIISEGNCLITVPDSGVGDATSKLNVSNNILIGLPVWVDGNQTPPPLSCLYYWNLASAKPNFSGNVIWKVKGETAPAGNTYADPHLANETLAAFDPTPTSATPPNVGAIRGPVVVPPPPVCPAVCVPKLVCTNSTVSAATCNAVCQ